MDATHVARVAFLARDSAWAAWLALEPEEEKRSLKLDMALAEYGDLRLVAAYVLETVCEQARTGAAAAAEGVEQVKRFRAEGDYEEEYFAPSTPADVVQAGLWCDRAAELRVTVSQEQQQEQRGGGGRTVSLGVGSRF
ncbi:hypothetical protein [Deinococcus sp. Leaf326]|uniref:hypothetical protein n=1 Tax=Deinococcus sp. Leaf326 TaxID=1736338 RepID=UPI0006F57A42|nr:hypothetical protein [Deinococcus sp. Leaf326]KQR40752.1 hypothetical protein ASF71_00865 [Deinococcus sp. Leaf326]